MKSKKILYSLLSCFLLISCGGEPSVSSSDSSTSSSISSISSSESSVSSSSISSTSSSTIESSESSTDSSSSSSSIIEDDKPADEVKEDGYKWKFNENDCINSTFDFSISSSNKDSYMEVYVDDKNEVYPLEDSAMPYQFMYEFGESESMVDGVEHCCDTVKVNNSNKYVQYLHNDLTKKVTFTDDNFKDGENYITINTGYTYQYKEFSFNTPGHKPGSCDDFEVKNIHLVAGDGSILTPTKICKHYLNKEQSKEITVIETDFDQNTIFKIGDGWSGSLSYLGNPDASGKWDRPLSIDFFFDIKKSTNSSNYSINTKKYSNGPHYLSVYAYDSKHDGEVVLQNNIMFDNQAPDIKVNVSDYEVIGKGYPFNIEITDAISSVDSYKVKLDGKTVDGLNVDSSSLSNGNHNLLIEASDIGGNIANLSRSFIVNTDGVNTFNAVGQKSSNKVDVSIDSNSTGSNKYTLFEANKLAVSNSKEKDYEYYEFNVSSITSKVYASFNASTYEYEKVLLEGYNPTSKKYEKIGTYYSGKSDVVIDSTNFYDNGKVKVRLSQYIEGNGSNKFVWASDTQYLAKVLPAYDDIRGYYTSLMTYVKNEYVNGNICYMVHTGDAVDDHPKLENAPKEWEVASKAFEIIDSVNMPYGISAGNHDVGSQVTDLEYAYYSSKFGLNRFKDADYLYGSMNDNSSFFNLISIGDYDFIVLYIGYGVESFNETIEWANKVLKQYSYRNAIIATHAYLDNGGALDPNARGQEIYDNIVVPNENVKLVMCGHTDGSEVVEKTIGDRKVYELLSCYQFVETLTDHLSISQTSHVTSGLKCNGEGFIKEMTICDGKLTAHTFSPSIKANTFSTTNGISYKQNDYTISLDLIKKMDRVINVECFEAAEIVSEVKSINSSKTSYSFAVDDINKTYLCYVINSNKGYDFVVIE